LEIELATRTMMNAGSGGAVGPELLPGSVDQGWPQTGLTAGLLENPLKAAAAGPPLNELSVDHCAPQNVWRLNARGAGAGAPRDRLRR
jgi:hypothetical protein